ncbi:MAG: filamentous hemagglutinin N-terminal domain-containing protein [Cyanothece sp. SIO1E1]|nr:filamentous hemagglutinin N-terminal domain-containing protein [Cyanothece sp. SIO1E1]
MSAPPSGKVLAQILPDNTLRNESSRVTPNVDVGGLLTDRIDGGAVRGASLFHSFLEFNVDVGQRVYFANPAGIEQILSRVTGVDPSDILGTLGVNGGADLFLLNPNGIVFGPNAQLDIRGSLIASTGERLTLPDGSEFSATNPQTPPLLQVNVPIGVQYGTPSSGTITNAGNLSAGQDLVLAAGELDLRGQLQAGGDLTLQAEDTVRIRDSRLNPFIAQSGGTLLIQGNQEIDILALNHPDSGVYAYGNMVLRSANQVRGDAHYWTGGNFRVETLNRDTGDLFSPVDPIIRSFGDVEIGQYFGASLHVLAGGKISIDAAVITGSAPGILGTDFLREAITLSDGTIVQIDGSTQPTLDLRAGVSPDSIGTPPLAELTGFNPFNPFTSFLFGSNISETPSSTDITIGNVNILAPDGLVLLTNQYQPNLQLSRGNIRVESPQQGGGIRLEGIASEGNVFLDARNNITVIDSLIATRGAGEIGDIKLIAQDTVEINNGVVRTIVDSGAIGDGGNIEIIADRLIVKNDAFLGTSSFGTGDSGDIILIATDSIIFDGESENRGFQTGAFSQIQEGAIGNSGDIIITTRSLEVINGGTLVAATEGIGDAGNILITAEESVVFDGPLVDPGSSNQVSSAFSGVRFGARGKGGNIVINAESLALSDQAQLVANTIGTGDSGNIFINVSGDVTLSEGRIFSNVLSRTESDGGDIIISAESLSLSNFSQLEAYTVGSGDAGDVIINISGDVTFDQSRSLTNVLPGATGNGGDIIITAESLTVANQSQLFANTEGAGDAGNLIVTTSSDTEFNNGNAFTNVQSIAIGNGGDIIITAESLTVANQAQLFTETAGTGDAGSLIITTSGDTEFNNGDAFTSVQPIATGNGGDIVITTDSLRASEGSQLLANTAGAGNSGNIKISATENILLENDSIGAIAFSSSELDDLGNGGDISLSAREGSIRGGSIKGNNTQLLAFSIAGSGGTAGKGGTIRLEAQDTISGFELLTPSSTGQSGAVQIEGFGDLHINNTSLVTSAQVQLKIRGLSISSSSINIDIPDIDMPDIDMPDIDMPDIDMLDIDITTQDIVITLNRQNIGQSGDVFITSPGNLTLDDVEILSDALGSNPAGNVTISSPRQITFIDSQVIASTNGDGNAGKITITAEDFSLNQGTTIQSSTNSSGNAGNINLDVSHTLDINGGSIAASTDEGSSGKSGSIIIDPTDTFIRNGGTITVDSQGSGQGGNILLISDQLTLDNGRITAITSASSGANITLELSGSAFPLRLRNNSLISAEALNNAQGGNVTINADNGFIVADLLSNSDIIARADQGRGGDIKITAADIFGMAERPSRPLNQTNDIDASSQVVGFNGTVTIETLTIEPDQGLVELPTEPVDTEIAQGCAAASPTLARGSREFEGFIQTGRGGMPPSPDDALEVDMLLDDLGHDVSVSTIGTAPQARTPTPVLPSRPPAQIVEAQGWVIDPNGQVILTAEATGVTPHQNWQPPTNCQEVFDLSTNAIDADD